MKGPFGKCCANRSRMRATSYSKPAMAPTHSANGSSRHPPSRSEEHTSELQSQSNLVCRLLLDKKKAGEAVLELGQRLPDALARSPVEDGVELRLRVRVARGEERYVVACVYEPVCDQPDDPLDA